MNLLVRVPLAALRDMEFPETGTGFLDIAALMPKLPDAARQWLSGFVTIYENQRILDKPQVVRTQISFPSDPSFWSYEQALKGVTGPPLPNSANAVWKQMNVDVLFEYRIASDKSSFAIRPGLEHLGARVLTLIRFLPPGQRERVFEVEGDPGIVELDPSGWQAAKRFIKLGFLHILSGVDHLLFLLCLVIPVRSIRGLVPVVTAFTVGHSITLIAAAYHFSPNFLWFPPLIETLIAASIFYMAIENIIRGTNAKRRWVVALVFGLVHGFGFSFFLRDSLQLGGEHQLSSLLSFNVGVEIGQLAMLALFVLALKGLFAFVMKETIGSLILSVLVAHTAWHWMLERGEALSLFR